MDWLQLAFDCRAEEVDALTDLLGRLGAESVSVSRGNGAPLLAAATENPGYWPASRIAALLPAEADLDILLACVRNAAGPGGLRNLRIEPVADRDWIAAGRAAQGVLEFGDRLCICPSWGSAPHGKQVLTLDPGLAFGTGAHATTALCLEWIATNDLAGRTVIDYGCGSGVLALAAARLGAAAVHAVDVDPVAVAVTVENALKNGLAARVSAGHPDGAGLVPVDLLVANILLGPLIELAPRFATLVRAGGDILLSGILATQAEACLGRYTRWFTMAAPRYRGEWALLAGRRRASDGEGEDG
jgi:ribosomal protein L11 methyltransferase